jgi:site-specific recombinase XerD
MTNASFIISASLGQTALDFMEGKQSLAIAINSFLIDCKARHLSLCTVKFYREYLSSFMRYAESCAISNIQEIDPDFLRSYILAFSDQHNEGGVHASFRSVRAFFHWIEKEELMPGDWKNPIKKVKAPQLPKQIIEPVQLEDVNSLIRTCKGDSFFDKRDKAIIFFLLDTGARAKETCNINLQDVDLSNGQVTIRQGKGREPRYVFINRTSLKALRSYLRVRVNIKTESLFVSKTMERLTYDGLRQILERRAVLAGLKEIPSPHDFRRQFALSMLRNKVNIFSLQRLMGHKDISILQRYLAQTTEDISTAHAQGSPVEHYSWG